MSLPAGREHRADGGCFVARVGREMKRLRSGDWEMLFMCVVGEMRYEEIAAALSVPVETVQQRIRQVRESLHSRLFSERSAAGLPDLRPASDASE